MIVLPKICYLIYDHREGIVSHFDHTHARTDEQREQMLELEQKGICPFCRQHFEANHRNPIIHETAHWLVTKNDYPYEGVEEQLLLVPAHTHVSSISELSEEVWADLFVMMSWITNHISYPGGSFLMRFGDTKYTGGTVDHLHAHLFFGVSRDDSQSSMKVKVGYSR